MGDKKIRVAKDEWGQQAGKQDLCQRRCRFKTSPTMAIKYKSSSLELKKEDHPASLQIQKSLKCS